MRDAWPAGIAATLVVVATSLASAPASAQEESADAPAEVRDAAAEPVDAQVEREEDARVAAQIAERQRLRPWHIAFGNLTWAATNVSTLLGFLQFNDRYGWDGDPLSTGCATGSPVVGDFCTGTPWPHAIAVTALTVFYGATFSIALAMPDPLDVGSGSSARATELTVHRALRWVTLGLIAVQIVLGAIVSNAGIDDFGTRRALAATHLAFGTATWAATTTMGVLGSLLAY
jgi:hypothetical protein